MARKRIIEAGAERARDSAATRWRDAAAHERYREMIVRDLGEPTHGPAGSLDDGRPVGLGALAKRPLGLFIIALVLFALVLGAKLWREGAFDPLLAPKGATPEQARKGWMLGDRLPPPALDKSATTEPVYAAPPGAPKAAYDQAEPEAAPED